MSDIKIAWGITGAGAFLKESINMIFKLPAARVDIFFSKAAEEVVKMYKLLPLVGTSTSINGYNIFYDRCASQPIIGRISLRYYDLLIIAPSTSNTVAKMAHGIADTLITNLFAQAGKAKVPTLVLPTDLDEVMVSETPAREEVKLYKRKVDFNNILLLRNMEYVTVVFSVSELRNKIKKISSVYNFGCYLLF